MISSDLKIGITFVIFNLEGSVPRSIDLLKTSLIISLECLSMLTGQEKNPYDTLLDIERISNLTSFGDIRQKKLQVICFCQEIH